MEHLCITYHMNRPFETAESCITLPMVWQTARDILENQHMSRHVGKSSPVRIILEQLAVLQGYDSADFCCAEDDPL